MAERDEKFLSLLQGIGLNEAHPINPRAIDVEPEGESTSIAVEADSGEPSPKQEQGEEPLAPLNAKNLFMHHDAHPLLLAAVLLQKFGPEWLNWEPETLWLEIKDDFKQSSISVHNRNKIQAVKTLHLVRSPWEAWEVFVPICHALCNNVPDFRTLHKPSPAQIMVTVDMMNGVLRWPFGSDTQKLIAAAFLDDSIYYLPPPVEFAQDEAMMLTYRCSKCGNIDRDDRNDVCDSCGAPASVLKREARFDFRPVQERFDAVVRLGKSRDFDLKENEVDIQVARLLVAWDFMNLRRQQFSEQARAVDYART